MQHASDRNGNRPSFIMPMRSDGHAISDAWRSKSRTLARLKARSMQLEHSGGLDPIERNVCPSSYRMQMGSCLKLASVVEAAFKLARVK